MKKRLFYLLLCIVLIFSMIPISGFAKNPTPLKIVKQPKDAHAMLTNVAKTSVTVTGDDLTYQWYFKNPTDTKFHKSSTTTATYYWRVTQKDSGRQVYCVITDGYGNKITSNTVTIYTTFQITQQPTNVGAAIGSKVSTKVSATGDDLQYQWYFKNPTDSKFSKSSTTSSTYTWKLTKKDSGRQVYCVITNRYGKKLTTDTVTLFNALQIQEQPIDIGAEVGKTVSAKVKASGDDLQYQWYFKNPTDSKFSKSSITTNTYSWKLTKKDSGRQVYCVITDRYGNKQKTNTITLFNAIQIKQQPTNVGVQAGATASAKVTATGDGITYQWYFKNPTDSKFSKSSITTDTYTWKVTKKDSGRQVYCLITDRFGNKVKTDVVTLKIPTPLKITAQPKNIVAKVGASGSATVTATGDGLTYQWYIKDRGATAYGKSSITGKTYSVKISDKNIGRKAYCVITDMFGNQTRTDIITFATAKANFDNDLYKVKPGGKKTLNLTITGNAKDEITYKSSNTSIAKVDSKGVVTGVKNGTVTITATGKNTGFETQCQVKVCNLKQIALTFDDGPGYYTEELLDFLKKNDIQVTFFLVGNRMSGQKEIIKRQAAEGHEIGYHSWDHAYQPSLSSDRITSDFNKANSMLKSYTGEGFTLWRTPYGGSNQRVLDSVPLPHIIWSVDTMDWSTLNTYSVYRSIVNNAYDGAIILLHDIHYTTVKGSIMAMEELMQGDYEFVTVTELLSRDGTPPLPHVTYSKG